jgi:hypothetical protein
LVVLDAPEEEAEVDDEEHGSIESFRLADGFIRGVDEEPEALRGIRDGGAMLLVSARGDGGRSEEYRRIGYSDIFAVAVGGGDGDCGSALW